MKPCKLKTQRDFLRVGTLALIAMMQLLSLSQQASATVIVKLKSIVPYANVPGSFRWSFTSTATSPNTDGVYNDNNVFFTIYDLPGNIATVEAPSLWGATGQLTGKTPAGLSPTDDPTKSNVTFTYEDNSSRPWINTVLPGETFDIMLFLQSPVALKYSWQNYTTYPVGNATLQSGLGEIADQVSVPEPATLVLVCSGLLGLTSQRKKFGCA